MFIFYAFILIEVSHGNHIPLHSSHQHSQSVVTDDNGRRKWKGSMKTFFRKKKLIAPKEDDFNKAVYQMLLNEIINKAHERDYNDYTDYNYYDDYDVEDETFIKPKLSERKKRLAEKKRDEGKMEVCENKLCSDQGLCRIYIKSDSKVQLCSCYPGYSGDYCQIGKPVENRVVKIHEDNLAYSLEDKNSRLLNAISSGIKSKIDDDYEDYYEGPSQKSSKNAECDSVENIVFSRRPPDETLAILLVCILIIAIIFTSAVLLAVDGDRRVLLERYEVLSRLGYKVDPPDVGLIKLLGHRMMFICCCFCHCCPWVDCCYCIQSVQNFETDIQLASAKQKNLQSAASTRITSAAPSSKSISWGPTTNH